MFTSLSDLCPGFRLRTELWRTGRGPGDEVSGVEDLLISEGGGESEFEFLKRSMMIKNTSFESYSPTCL